MYSVCIVFACVRVLLLSSDLFWKRFPGLLSRGNVAETREKEK